MTGRLRQRSNPDNEYSRPANPIRKAEAGMYRSEASLKNPRLFASVSSIISTACFELFNREVNSTSFRETLPPKTTTDAHPSIKVAEPPTNVKAKATNSPYSVPLLRGLKVRKTTTM